MQSPRTSHWAVVLRILRYHRKCLARGLFYRKHKYEDPLYVEGFADSDRAGSVFDRRSTSGYCIRLGGNLVIWKSKKQKVVARLSAEVEYRSMAKANTEMMWQKMLLAESGFEVHGPMQLWCDNQATIHIANNLIFTKGQSILKWTVIISGTKCKERLF